METNILSGTNAGALLDSEIDDLLEKWDTRHENPDAGNWVGFGVSLDRDRPEIVYFHNDEQVVNSNRYDTMWTNRRVIPASFRTIPGRRGRGPTISRYSSTSRGTEPGDDIEARADAGGVTNDGTLGVFLVDDNGSRWALSANHTVGFNGQFEDLSVSVPRTGLELVTPRCIKIVCGVANAADAAVVSCAQSAEISAPIPRLPIATRQPLLSPASGTVVMKVGNATPIPFPGRLAYLAARVEVIQDQPRTIGFSPCEFANQWVIRSEAGQFAQSGDSGALVVAKLRDQNVPLGLLIAVQNLSNRAATSLSIATPLQSILGGFDGTAFQLDPSTLGERVDTRLKLFTLSDAFRTFL